MKSEDVPLPTFQDVKVKSDNIKRWRDYLTAPETVNKKVEENI